MLRGEKLWQIILQRLRLQTQCWIAFASISEVGKMSALKNLEAKPHLRKNDRIRSIYSSLRIEANSLSIGQVRDVISGQLVLGEQKEIRKNKKCIRM